MTRKPLTPLLACAVLILAACSSGGGSATPPAAAPQPSGDAVAIQITNDLVPPSQITVYIVPETGSRRRLGTVAPNGQASFNFSPGLRTSEHRLVAEVTGGGEKTSNPFTLERVTGVRWGVSVAVVNLQR